MVACAVRPRCARDRVVGQSLVPTAHCLLIIMFLPCGVDLKTLRDIKPDIRTNKLRDLSQKQTEGLESRVTNHERESGTGGGAVDLLTPGGEIIGAVMGWETEEISGQNNCPGDPSLSLVIFLGSSGFGVWFGTRRPRPRGLVRAAGIGLVLDFTFLVCCNVRRR